VSFPRHTNIDLLQIVLLLVLSISIIITSGLTKIKDSFTFGEASILSHLVAILYTDVGLSIASKLFDTSKSVIRLDNLPSVLMTRSDGAVNLMEIGLTCALGIAILPYVFFPRKMATVESFLFYSSLVTLAVLTLLLMYFMMDTNPVVFIALYTSEKIERLFLVMWWTVVLILTLGIAPTATSTGMPNIIVRKIYHFVAVLLFFPAIILDIQFLKLALAVAFSFLLVAEYMRLVRVPPFGIHIHDFMVAYVDEKDRGVLVMTHLYLLLGCAIPVWVRDISASVALARI
jgi:dolichol kinase